MGVHVTPSWRFGRGRRTLPAPMLGSMAALESGSDTLSIITTNVFYGTMAASESGSDTLAWSGDIHVRGSVAAQEFGADTTIINGPSVGSLSTSLYVTSATAGTKAFCIGHAFVMGEVPTGGDVSVSGASASVQTTQKNYWSDGSLKFAILAGTYVQSVASATVELSVSSGSAVSGSALTTADLKATGITASFNAGAFGSASWSGTDWDTYAQAWISGPMMSSWLYRKQIGTDAHLVAWMEVRLFANGAVEVLPWVENGYINVSAPTNKSATYTFTLGGSSRYSDLIDLPHHCRTPLLTGTAVSYWLGTDPGVTPKHTTDYLKATGLVPSYDSTVSAGNSRVTGLPSSFTPLQLGSHSSSMGGGGYHGGVGLLPYWDALYFTTSGDVWKPLQWNHYNYGRYAIHYREDSTVSGASMQYKPPLFASYPNTRLSQAVSEAQQGIAHMGSSSTGTYLPVPSGTVPPQWVDTHHPSAGFVPYLLTGRFYFLEELQFAASICFLRTASQYSQGSKGIFDSSVDQTRGLAFSFRTLAQAAAITPDSDTTLRTQYIDSFKENVSFYHARYVAQTHNSYGWIQQNQDQDAASGYWSQLWMDDYITMSFGYAKDLAPELDATSQAKLDALFAWKAQAVVGRLGGAGATEWIYRNAVPYYVSMSPSDTPNWSTGAQPWHASWGATYDAVFSGVNSSISSSPPYAPDGSRTEGGNLVGGDFGNVTISSVPGGYWGYMQPAIAYAVKHGVTGADDGWRRLTNAPNWYVHVQAGETESPEWHVVPTVLPAWRQGQAVNEWREISGTAMSGFPPSVDPGRDSDGEHGKMDAWCGLSIDTRTNTVWALANGGHDNYHGNEVVKFDLNSDEPVWTEVLASNSAGEFTYPTNTVRYSSGRPASVHSYYSQQFIERHDRAVRVGTWAVATQAAAFWNMEAFDSTSGVGVNGWDALNTYDPIIGSGTPVTQDHATCKDPDTEQIYFFYQNASVRRFTPGTTGGTWAQVSVGSPPASAVDSAAAWDSRRSRAFVFSRSPSGATGICHTFDPVTGAYTARTLTSEPAALAASKGGLGMVYVPYLDAYLVRIGASGNTVYKIDASTFAVTTLSTSGGTVPAVNFTPTSTAYENVYTRWLFAPSLRGIVYFPRYSANAWFLRLY
jgi:hypothetical protein